MKTVVKCYRFGRTCSYMIDNIIVIPGGGHTRRCCGVAIVTTRNPSTRRARCVTFGARRIFIRTYAPHRRISLLFISNVVVVRGGACASVLRAATGSQRTHSTGGISGRAALWSTPGAAGPVAGSSGTASRWSGTAPCSGRTARWTTSRTRTRPGWTACRSGTRTTPAGRRCRNSATPGTGCPRPRRTPGTVGRRSKSPCTAPRPAPDSPFPVCLGDNKPKTT